MPWWHKTGDKTMDQDVVLALEIPRDDVMYRAVDQAKKDARLSLAPHPMVPVEERPPVRSDLERYTSQVADLLKAVEKFQEPGTEVVLDMEALDLMDHMGELIEARFRLFYGRSRG